MPTPSAPKPPVYGGKGAAATSPGVAHMQRLSAAADACATADLISTRSQAKQDYSLWPLMGAIGCALPGA
jgi:hypothetical protein